MSHEQLEPLLKLTPQQTQVDMLQNINMPKFPEPPIQVQVDPGSPVRNKPPGSPLPSRVPSPASRTPPSPLPGSRRVSRAAARQLTPQDALFNTLIKNQSPRSPSPCLRSPSTPLTEDGAEGLIDVNQYRSIVHGNNS